MAEKEKNLSFEKQIEACHLFKGMSNATKTSLMGLSALHYKSGDMIVGEDEGISKLGVILSGKVNIFGLRKSGRVLLNRLDAGNVFGAATVFSDEMGSISTVVAASASDILFVPRERLDTILKTDHTIASNYIKLLLQKIFHLNSKILSYTAKSADSALAGYLLSYAEKSEAMSFNMSRLAMELDIGRTTLYRALDALASDGLIACEGKHIRILDKEKLEKRMLI